MPGGVGGAMLKGIPIPINPKIFLLLELLPVRYKKTRQNTNPASSGVRAADADLIFCPRVQSKVGL